MIPWAAFERRWLEALARAMIPRAELRTEPRAAPDERALPGLEDLELGRFFDELRAAAPPLLALGVRASVWILTLSPPILIGKLATFGGLGADDRDALLTRAASSRSHLVRQLVLVVKLVACFAYFRDARVRSAFARTSP